MARWNKPRRTVKAGAEYATKVTNYIQMQRQKAQEAHYDRHKTELFLRSDPVSFFHMLLEQILEQQGVKAFADLTPFYQAHFGKLALLFEADDSEFSKMSKVFKDEELMLEFVALRNEYREGVFANLKSPPIPDPMAMEPEEFGRTYSIEHLISFEDQNFLPFLASNRDPHLWWAVVNGLNFDSRWTESTLLWLVSQPDCENTIVIQIMTLFDAATYCGTENSSKYGEILAAISQREEADGYPSTELCDPPGLNRGRLLQQCIDAEAEFKRGPTLETGSVSDTKAVFPVPYNILKKRPTGAPINSLYFYDECGIAEYVRNDEPSRIPVEPPSTRAAFSEQRKPIPS